ncbi:ABC transporter ATP-binding protein [Sphingobium sp. CAP-1]|uniref:ABC transporter ATP-binding protein n=1 Tax=Sphingobium sp. CAP-1 TaxID=2676077 RepID=UPI0012BB2AFF|nr:ATP-binding cassette domain-containing protein [Sphingobium sp. CAP-1]QGP79506.1 ATP-binding cassette domain-containing protein [Sphingobium sp. CAP-1]
MIGDTPAPALPYAVEGHGLVKTFGAFRAVDGVDIAVPAGAIYGVLGPNGAGKTTLLRTLLGIIDPDEGRRTLLGEAQPLRMARAVGYLPEERGLYPSMKAYEAIAFMGALRGLPLHVGRERAKAMLEGHGMGASIDKPIRQLSKGMAQTVQLFGTIVHEPRLIVLDEPFSGLDAINQEKLEGLIREQARAGVTILFSTHVIAHAERLCERIAIVAGGRIRFEGTPAQARDRLRAQVRLRTRAADGPWRGALPADTVSEDGAWHFALPDAGIEPLLRALIDGQAGIESLSIERPGLHDAFVAIAGAAAAKQMQEPDAVEETA